MNRLWFVGLLTISWAACSARGDDPHRGLNLPPTQGTTNAGAFQTGVYRFDYSPEFLKQIPASGFTHIRVPVNVATSKDSEAMQKIASLFSAVGDRGILCMFDTNEAGETGHGNGKPNDVASIANAWRQLYRMFRGKPNIVFELFNEPFGYAKTAAGRDEYINDMKIIIRRGRLPSRRCIIDGMGYADDIQSVAKAGWRGALGYHFYPNWLGDDDASAEAFSKLIVQQCSGISNDIYITEFGTRLDFDKGGRTPPENSSQDHDALVGLREAINFLKGEGRPIKGAYHWHGWDNGDTYSYWDQANRLGALKIREIQDGSEPKLLDQ
ncbi:Cellulase (glycosyl hydrolase family 5) [Rubripirellula obstinata]|uniref:Cellulase (Glycosyl hydrolase family 5) n=1 Tax=Rubripirellula obstinata TaxID=406547 RepID=A0A5B1CHV5_9BACT|nr:cellulase family glycosylhydrolase [Rubripirellula obstinata]KAA1260768.1 Cellulase (glycosyl hydrolase family 5) [Rubripirellula obstinata]